MGLGVATISSAQAQAFTPLFNLNGASPASTELCRTAASKPGHSDPKEGRIPGSEPYTQNRAALLAMCNQNAGPVVDETVLCKLHGLTRGEAALAACLLQGKSIQEAAAQLLISPHTARTHLKRIFMKTNTHRQLEADTRLLAAGL